MSEVEAGTLWVVATPIGNLGDLSGRAAEVLRGATVILCEDTRHSGPLLRNLGCQATLVSLHAHNEGGRVPAVLAALSAGKQVALVSDAGTPCLSDPGALLVAAVHRAGLPVRTVPGPFSVAAALAASGLTPIPFAFWGFVSKAGAARRRELQQRLQPAPGGAPMTHALLAPGRDLAEVLADIAALAPSAEVVVGRELTKVHESYHRGRAVDLAVAFDPAWLRGEAVVLVEVATPAQATATLDVDAALRAARASGDAKEALRALARATGLSRRVLYQRMVALPTEDAAGGDAAG